MSTELPPILAPGICVGAAEPEPSTKGTDERLAKREQNNGAARSDFCALPGRAYHLAPDNREAPIANRKSQIANP